MDINYIFQIYADAVDDSDPSCRGDFSSLGTPEYAARGMETGERVRHAAVSLEVSIAASDGCKEHGA